MQLTGCHNGNEMRNTTCVDTKISIEWPYCSFLYCDIIKKEVEAREGTERIKADNTQPQGNKSHGHNSTAGLFLSKEDQKFTIRCAYCKELHFSASCTKVTDPEKRKETLRNTNRCFNCLRIGHRVCNCQSSKCCRHCKQRHHQSICGTLNHPIQEKKENTNKTKPESKGTTTTSNMGKRGTVLLQTARTTATNFDGNENDRNEEIDVLIGSDFYWQIVTGEMKKGESGPVALSSKLGWLLSGPLHDSATTTDVQSNLIISGKSETNYGILDEEQDLVGTLKMFWETEAIGIRQPENAVQSKEFTKYVYRQGDRYEVTLPWKGEHLPIPNNYELSCNRLRSMHAKLQKKPELLKEYDQIIKEQLSCGIIEVVPEEEVVKIEVANATSTNPQNEDIHYIPHHAVIRQNRETTKVRVIYDGSAKSKDQHYALNDCLETGPNYIPHLLEVLLRFHWNPIAISADIERAFLMIGISPDD